MADDASEDSLRRPVPLAIRYEGDEEEKTGEAGEYDNHNTIEEDASGERVSMNSSISKAQLRKDRRRAASDASAEATNATGDNDSDFEADGLKRRQMPLPSSSTGGAAAMRSPSRLATSLLVGRDRMARAARAWRDGARRAGLFGSDNEDDEDEDDEAMYNDEKKNEWGSSRTREMGEMARDSAASDRGSEAVPESTGRVVIPSTNQHPSSETLAVNRAGALPLSMIRLVPSRLAPAMRLPKMAQLWAWLDRIECIAIRDVYETHDDVDDSGVTVHYVLDVYNYQEQHSLPTHRYHGSSHRSSIITTASQPQLSPLRKPDYHIQHRFSSFTKLRSRLLKATHRKHPRGTPHQASTSSSSNSYRHCTYCQKLAQFLAAGNDFVAPLGWRAKFFTTVDMRKTLLSQFVLQLVFLARDHRDACSNLHPLSVLHQPPSRYVHRSVPGILRRFLTVQTGENFMR